MTGVQTCALPICFPVTIRSTTFLLTQNYGIKLIANGTNWEIAGPAQQVIFNGVYPTTSGTSFTIPINNPGVTTRKITVVLTSVGIGTVTDDYLIQIGNSTCSSFKTSGYESSGTIPGTRDTKSTAGFIFTHGGSGSSGTFSGLMTIFLANPDQPTHITRRVTQLDNIQAKMSHLVGEL